MTNKISAQAAPETVAKALQCIDELKGLMPFLVTATKNDRTNRQNMGQSGIAYGKTALKIAKANPETLKVSFDITEFEKDVSLFEAVSTIEASMMTLCQSLNDTKVLVGQEIMDQSNETYDEIKSAARRDNKYKPAAVELGDYYKKRNTKDIVVPPKPV
jgi:hypothetical protein